MLEDTKNLCLRPFERDDWQHVSRWFYSPDYLEFFRDVSAPLTVAQMQTYAAMQNGESYIIMLNSSHGEKCGTVVGMIIMYDRVQKAGLAKLGILIDKAYQRSRFCLEAMCEISRLLFVHQGLRKLVVEIVSTNDRLIKVVERGGFQAEAVLKAEAVIGGHVRDVHRFSLMNTAAFDRIQKMEEILWEQE